jgi:hypothetical protein
MTEITKKPVGFVIAMLCEFALHTSLYCGVLYQITGHHVKSRWIILFSGKKQLQRA